METRRLIVTGTVQGVFYRDWTVDTARTMDVSGWVRNRDDGSVEIMANGTPQVLEAFARACREGPSRARVESVEVHSEAPERFDSFRRR